MSEYPIHPRLVIEEMGCIFIAIETFMKMDHIPVDSIERFFSFRRRASRDNLVGFANCTCFAFCGRRAICQPNACDGRGQMFKNLRSTVCKTLVPNSSRRLRNTGLCRTDNEC